MGNYLHQQRVPPPPPLVPPVQHELETLPMPTPAITLAATNISIAPRLTRQRRRPFPWWLGLAIVGIIALLGWALLHDGRTSRFEEEESVSTPSTSSTPVSSPAASRVPAEVATFRGHAYKFYPEQVSWHVARQRCEMLGGYLVIIESHEENRVVADLIQDAGRLDAWIGFTDEAQEGYWRTVHGKPLTFAHWYDNQPNNKSNQEHYALISNRTLTGRVMNWTWCDQPIESTQHQPGYVCEWDTSN
jgi:hypothetical protein